jgi:hypothetical protein
VLIGSAAGLTLAVAALTLWKLSAPQQTATSSRTGSFSAAQEGPVGVMPAAIHAEPADPRAAFSDSLSRRVEKAPAASADVRVAKMPSRTAPAPSKDADISAFFPKK